GGVREGSLTLWAGEAGFRRFRAVEVQLGHAVEGGKLPGGAGTGGIDRVLAETGNLRGDRGMYLVPVARERLAVEVCALVDHEYHLDHSHLPRVGCERSCAACRGDASAPARVAGLGRLASPPPAAECGVLGGALGSYCSRLDFGGRGSPGRRSPLGTSRRPGRTLAP